MQCLEKRTLTVIIRGTAGFDQGEATLFPVTLILAQGLTG